MPFVKLDTKILDSTLWIERECREIFITALLMAEPLEVTSPTEAIKTDCLEPLGFIVPPGWYGFVPAAGPGIIRRAMVDLETGRTALAELSAPDAGSRSPEFQGRRMVRVDGGYLILNYMKYRDKDYTAAERQRRLRERRKQSSKVTPLHNAVTRNSNVTSRIADADADADADKSKPPTEDEVFKIAQQHPRIRDPRIRYHALELAICEAVARDGFDLVWAGTKSFGDAFKEWPKAERRFAVDARKFFAESLYKTDPEEWTRKEKNSNGRLRAGLAAAEDAGREDTPSASQDSHSDHDSEIPF